MDLLAIAVLILSTCGALLLTPDVRVADLIEPAIQASVATPIVLAALVVGRLASWPAIVERALLAAFLFFMPTVYLLSLALHGGGAPWPVVEVGGQVIFAAIAVVGFRYAPWVLVAGLAAHGLLWDSWHHGRTTFIPDWYTVGCLVVDVGWAFYAASRVTAWSAATDEQRRSGVTVGVRPRAQATL